MAIYSVTPQGSGSKKQYGLIAYDVPNGEQNMAAYGRINTILRHHAVKINQSVAYFPLGRRSIIELGLRQLHKEGVPVDAHLIAFSDEDAGAVEQAVDAALNREVSAAGSWLKTRLANIKEGKVKLSAGANETTLRKKARGMALRRVKDADERAVIFGLTRGLEDLSAAIRKTIEADYAASALEGSAI